MLLYCFELTVEVGTTNSKTEANNAIRTDLQKSSGRKTMVKVLAEDCCHPYFAWYYNLTTILVRKQSMHKAHGSWSYWLMIAMRCSQCRLLVGKPKNSTTAHAMEMQLVSLQNFTKLAAFLQFSGGRVGIPLISVPKHERDLLRKIEPIQRSF